MKQTTKVFMAQQFNLNQLNKNERSVLDKFIDQREQDKSKLAKIEVEKVKDVEILNSQGTRLIVRQRKAYMERLEDPIKTKKKSPPKVAIDPVLVDKLVTNIMNRSAGTDTIETQQT